MAFQQPTTRQATQRVYRPTPDSEDGQIDVPPPPQTSQPVEDSQTWVLFSPATDIDTASSYLTSTNKSNDITPGRSRLSDVGSLNTHPRSDLSAEQPRSASLIDVIDENDEDDAELDSLDSHLPEFRSNPNLYASAQSQLPNAPVVPAHDGLGSFRLEQEGMGSAVQDRLYAFEQYNPRRVKRRRESFELAQAQLREEEAQDMEKMRWIEAWRLEQSRLLLDQIHKETRRRRRSNASRSSTHATSKLDEHDAMFSTDSREDQGTEWHEQNASEPGAERESIWGRITRKVVRDILGVDDKMLAILFGEALPDEEELSPTPRASSPQPQQQQRSPTAESATDANWQLRMLERVAKELGLLIHQLSEHPGAFSTFSRVQQMPIPYAGLPSIPETASDNVRAPSTARESRRTAAVTTGDDISVAIPEFQPTIGTQTRPIDIAHARRPSTTQASAHTGGAQDTRSSSATESSGGPATFTQEEWEQDLDIRLVFRYLRSRFMPRSSGGSGGAGGASHHHHHHHHRNHHSHHLHSSAPSAASAQDIAAKAARVRQHHPLIAAGRLRNPTTTAAAMAQQPMQQPQPQQQPAPVIFRTGPASSCASQSTRRSVTATRSLRSVRSSLAGSSRHYWDIGAGSAGTGSVIAAATTGPMGSWGEV